MFKTYQKANELYLKHGPAHALAYLETQDLRSKKMKVTIEWTVLIAFLLFETDNFVKSFDMLTECIEKYPNEELPKECYKKFKAKLMDSYLKWMKIHDNTTFYYECLEFIVHKTELFSPPELITIFKSIPKTKRVITLEMQIIVGLAAKFPMYHDYFAAYGITLNRVLDKCA